MIAVMSILLFLVFRAKPNQAEIAETSLAETANFDATVAAIVAASLQSTPTPQLTLDEVNPSDPGAGLDDGSETQGEAKPENLDTITQRPMPTMTPTTTLTPEPTLTKTPIAWVENRIASMSLSQKVGQMIMTGVTGTELTTDTCQFIQRVSPGGVVYLGANISGTGTDQLRALSTGLQNCMYDSLSIPLLIALDHEGQYVNRFPDGSQMTIFPPAMAVGAVGDPNLAYQAALASGLELGANGINTVLGPVADVLTNYDNTVISQRSYGGDPIDVGEMVTQAVQGYLAAGVLPVIKHYPGHGGVSGDSHDVLPVDNTDLGRLLDTHLVPYRAVVNTGAPSIMISHVAFPAVDPENLPASLSAPMYQLLEGELGFQGFSLSDSMGMGAVGSTGLGTNDASVEAVKAGLDMLLLTSPGLAESVHGSVLWAIQNGSIPLERIDQAVRNILTVKHQHGLGSFPLKLEPAPDWSANADLSYRIGRQAVSLYKDQTGLVPLPDSVRNVLVVGPVDNWGLYPLFRTAFNQKAITYNIMTYSGYWYGAIPETIYLQTVPARAPNYDLVIVFTWDSHLNQFKYNDTFQAQLVNTLLNAGYPPLVIALKSPTDILDFPNVPAYLATMGTTRGQVHALLDVLLGDTKPIGEIPLPALP